MHASLLREGLGYEQGVALLILVIIMHHCQTIVESCVWLSGGLFSVGGVSLPIISMISLCFINPFPPTNALIPPF